MVAVPNFDGPDISDALAGAIKGDEASFGVLWRALNPPLLRYLRVVAGDTFEDVASETWLQASRDLGGFTGDAKQFRVWLFRIARNRAIDDARKAQRQPADPVAAIPEQRSGDDTAEAAMAAMATRQALAVIAELPRDQAEAVLLRAVAGLSAEQAALVTGKRAGAVRVAAMRGLRNRKKKLERAQAPEKQQVTRLAKAGSRTGVTR